MIRFRDFSFSDGNQAVGLFMGKLWGKALLAHCSR
jgi:hypothetical protein